MYRVPSIASVLGLACLVGCASGPVDTTPDESIDDSTSAAVQPDLLAGMSVVALEAGTFYMGSDVSDPDRSVDEELHLVEIASAFEMADTEVTREQFVEYMGYDPVALWTPDDEAIVDCMDCPIQSVSWHEAAAFANALSKDNGLQECFDCSGADSDVFCTVAVNPYECEGYRMPTEAEWEYAARAVDETTYAGSNDVEDVAWYRSNSDWQVHPVAMKTANAWGLYDMSGNIREMVLDWYNPWFPEDMVNPVALPGEGSRPVERGGSFACIPEQLRVSTRYQYSGAERDTHVGFRVARALLD